jgi:hypothetical protein
MSSRLLLASLAALAMATACGESAGSADDAGRPQPAARATAGWPNSIALLSHSGGTGEWSDPSQPGVEVRENVWATGTNPDVRSVYLRILEHNPAIEGHSATYAQAGASIDDVAAQADQMLADEPADLILIWVMDNDLTCPLDREALREFRAKLTTLLGRLSEQAPTSKQVVFTQFGSVRSYASTLTRAERSAMGGTGPCDFFAPSGHVNPAKARRLERAIRAYEHALARSCARVRQCTFDGGAFGRIVDRRKYYGGDHNHLSVQGHAKVAEVAWKTLVREGVLPRP